MNRDTTDPWAVLGRGGLPLAGRPPGPSPSAEELAAAVRAVHGAPPDPASREADALHAFLLAWRHHWPQSFARSFGADAPALARWTAESGSDVNRLLKLRRIAIEKLATIL